ncbi:MAG: phosphoribosylanthranilate isomerase [Lachnospiraceae bacterium]
MRQTEIKICGLTTEEDIEAVNQAGVQYAGFVFFEKSKRNLSFEKAEALLKCLSPKIQSVAVVVSPDDAMIEKLNAMPFSIVQMHQTVTEEIVKKSRHPVWQAVNIAKIDEAASQILDDAKIEGYVMDAASYGSGKTFAWEPEKAQQLRGLCHGKKLILAGGLCPENVTEGIRIFAPDVVDVSSGVEKSSGIGKEKNKILEFAGKVRNYE